MIINSKEVELSGICVWRPYPGKYADKEGITKFPEQILSNYMTSILHEQV